MWVSDPEGSFDVSRLLRSREIALIAAGTGKNADTYSQFLISHILSRLINTMHFRSLCVCTVGFTPMAKIICDINKLNENDSLNRFVGPPRLEHVDILVCS